MMFGFLKTTSKCRSRTPMNSVPLSWKDHQGCLFEERKNRLHVHLKKTIPFPNRPFKKILQIPKRFLTDYPYSQVKTKINTQQAHITEIFPQ